MRYLIADLVTEFEPKYESLKKLAAPFAYEGNRETDIRIEMDDAYIQSLLRKMVKGTAIEDAEGLAVSSAFNRRAIRFDTMLVHSSALVLDGKAYLFSANSGVGKSTHTREKIVNIFPAPPQIPSRYRTVLGYKNRTSENCAI